MSSTASAVAAWPLCNVHSRGNGAGRNDHRALAIRCGSEREPVVGLPFGKRPGANNPFHSDHAGRLICASAESASEGTFHDAADTAARSISLLHVLKLVTPIKQSFPSFGAPS